VAVDPSGPHLIAALICERVLQEQDGAVTAVRIIDRVTFATRRDQERLPYPIWFLIMFKSGSTRGSHTVRIEVETPSTERLPVLEAQALFEGEDRGVNVVVNAHFAPSDAGVYWYDVYFGDTRVTRIPLRAIFHSLPQAPSA
jgi:hypothetical protein